MQRKELSKEDEASMNVEVNLIQQRFNKIELEKLKKRSFMLRNKKKGKNARRISNKNDDINQEIQSAIDRRISPYKAFKQSNSGLSLSTFYKKKKIYNEDNAFANRREESGRNPKLNEKLIGFILVVLFKDRKQTLASLVKILNDNFGVKVSEKTINKVLHAHNNEWTKPILIPKFDERMKKSRIEFCKYYLYIVDNARYVYTDEIHFYTKNSIKWKMGISRWGVSWRTMKIEKPKNKYIRCNIMSIKIPIDFLHRQHGLKKYIEWVSEILSNIRDIFENKFVLYMDNNVKHVSVETLKWYSSCEIEIEIETGPPHSPDIYPIENVWWIIKKKLKGYEFKMLMSLKHVWRVSMMKFQ